MENDIIVSVVPTKCERETLFSISAVDDYVECDSTIPRDFNKCLRQGWTVVRRYVTSDGTVVGLVCRAPIKSLCVRKSTPIKRAANPETIAKMKEARAQKGAT